MTFLKQFAELQARTPRIGLQCVDNENSPFCQYTEKSKNCYMTFASGRSEDCLYNTRVYYCTDCTDCAFLHKCELCYECIDCVGCYNASYCFHCENSVNASFCSYCIGVQDCFGCVGLNKKSFCIFNEQFTPEEYGQRLIELNRLPIEEVMARVEELSRQTPRPAMDGKNNEDCFGNNLYNSKNCFWVFDSERIQDCRYVYHAHDECQDLMDCSHLGWCELGYQVMNAGNLTDCMFCFGCWSSSNLEYCELVYNSHDCFGCIGLNHKEYHILNKPFSKEAYFKEVARIKDEMKAAGEWGKWFDSTYPEVLTYGI